MALTSDEFTNEDIANIAMDILGESDITDFQTPTGKIETAAVRRLHDGVSVVMRLAKWSVARAAIKIGTSPRTDDLDYRAQSQLPDDCAKVWSVGGNEKGWTVVANGSEGGLLLHNAPGPIYLIYGRRLEAGEMPAQLARLCGAQLALDLVTTDRELTRKRNDVRAAFNEALRNAAWLGEGGADVVVGSDWLNAVRGT